MRDTALDRRVAAVRGFNRFYTRRIGVLQEHLLASPFSLAQARVLYELAHRDDASATDLGRDLALDAGYLSRILHGFRRRGFVVRTASPLDGRRGLLRLTPLGRRAFAGLDAASRAQVGTMLGALTLAEQSRLIQAMADVQVLLGAGRTGAPVVLRSHRAGDMGWVVERHGVVYSREFGWGERFEGLVAGIVSDFLRTREPQRERCWIAERDGVRVGSVFLVRRSERVGQLRLLLVEPEARGLGVGAALVAACLAFARKAGYRKVRLWTVDLLHGARRLYQRAGFTLVREERVTSFGRDLAGQVWELVL
ncbi:MAG TPA: helix-turn-helix domain-containing GNAT family N-acetyltransferase [Gemmatimonadales bacterium]